MSLNEQLLLLTSQEKKEMIECAIQIKRLIAELDVLLQKFNQGLSKEIINNISTRQNTTINYSKNNILDNYSLSSFLENLKHIEDYFRENLNKK